MLPFDLGYGGSISTRSMYVDIKLIADTFNMHSICVYLNLDFGGTSSTTVIDWKSGYMY